MKLKGLSMQVDVLDKGFVRLEQCMGFDRIVVRSARVSYGKTEINEEKDKKLISYMLRHDHGTPFEHAVFTFHVKLPIFAARQWIRHRMGSFNEYSMRYSEVKDEFYYPDKWRTQDKVNRQGSVWGLVDDRRCTKILKQHSKESMANYRSLLKLGVAKEMARMVIPVNIYTEWYWTVNARALMHFIDLRSDKHAQWEMRQYSNAVAKLLQTTMPWTFAAFMTECSDKEMYGRRNFEELNKSLEAV